MMLFGWPLSCSAAEPALNLRQLIEAAKHNNKDVQVARYAVDVGRGRLVQAGLLPNPRLDLSARSDFLFGNEGEYGRSATISQQFPIAGRILREKDVARVDVALAQAEVDEAEWRLAGNVASAVYQILLIDRQVQSRDVLIAIEGKLAKATRDRFKAAEVSELDVNTVQLDLQRLAQEQVLLQSQRESQMVALNTLLGRPADAVVSIGEPLPETDEIPSLAQLQSQALMSRPDFRAALLGADRALSETALAKAQRWEDWSAGLVFEQDKLFINGGPPQRSSRAIGLTLTIPLPLLNKNQGSIAAAQASNEQAAARIDALRLSIAGEVAGAHAETIKLQQLLTQFHQTLLALSARNVALAQKGYGQGLVSVVEVVQAQRQQADLNASYLNTLDQFLQALARLRNADGYYIAGVDSTSASTTKDH